MLIALLIGGASFLGLAFTTVARHKDRSVAYSALLGSVGSALVTGAIFAMVTISLESALQKSQADVVWRANVATSSEMAGFNPAGHSLFLPEKIDFSGKILHDANFRNADLHGIQFRDSDLRGADFQWCEAGRASFVGADLTATNFQSADLSGANLSAAHLTRAQIAGAKSLKGATVNANTCRPSGFLRDRTPACCGVAKPAHRRTNKEREDRRSGHVHRIWGKCLPRN